MSKYVGTSGYSYHHWVDRFYPADLPEREWLGFYAQHFNSVEINNSFYHLPLKSSYERWGAETPADFSFAIKGSRFISHIKKLKDTAEGVDRFFERAGGLADKLQVVLWQLPANFHASWFTEDVYAALREHNFALCISDSPRWTTAAVATADFVYVRLHGHTQLYASNYADDELRGWAERLSGLAGHRDLYIYFDNDGSAYAVKNAQTLRQLLD